MPPKTKLSLFFSVLPQGDHLCTGLQAIQVISPGLHHAPALGQVLGPVVCPAKRITDCMSQLMFYEIRANLQHFVKDGSRHCPESMAGHFVLFKTHSPQGRKNAVVAHRPFRCPRAWEYIPAGAGQGIQFPQDFNGLACQRNQMRLPGLHFLGRNIPFRRIKIDFRPFRLAKLARTHEKERSKAHLVTKDP